jgi:HlyD family secretion protein
VRIRRRALLAAGAAAALAGALAVRPFSRSAAAGEAVVRRGTLLSTVPVVGTLQPERADVYAPEVPGVELKVLWLAPEGTVVAPGEPLVTLDAAPFARELEAAAARERETEEELKQAQAAADAASLSAAADAKEAEGAARAAERERAALEEADAPLTLAQSAHDLEEKRREADLAAEKLAGLEPFAKDGAISREELNAARARREQAASDLALAEAKDAALRRRTLPDLLKKRSDEAHARREQVGLVSRRASAQVAQARAQLALAAARREEAGRQRAEAERKVARCRMNARGRGLVVWADVFDKAGEKRKVRVGDSVWGGAPVVLLPDLSSLAVEGRVPESEIHRLKPGERVEVRLDAFPDEVFGARLRSIGSVGGGERNDARAFPVSVRLDASDPRFRPGMLARASVLSARLEDVVYVPIEAVRVDGPERSCTVVGALGGASRRRVVTGRTTASFVEIVRGLTPGEVVRLEP